MKSLRSRLMLTYALVAVFGILAVLFSSNFLVNYQFSILVQTRIAREVQVYTDTLPKAYLKETGWNSDALTTIGLEALTRGYVVKLVDEKGLLVWDAETHNAGLCTAMLNHMAMVMESYSPGWKGTYEQDTFPIKFGPNLEGRVTFGHYGPYFFNDSELEFLKVLNGWILILGLLVLVGSLLLGAFMARWISRPILRVTEAAHQIRLGNWTAPIVKDTAITEIEDLSLSIQLLGQNLQEQESLRKRLTVDVSHELRTPLCILQAKLEALIDGIIPTDKDQLETLRQEVLRLTRIVGQLENLTKVDVATEPATITKLNSLSFLKSLLKPFEADAMDKKIALKGETQDFSFLTDDDKVRQILFNLVSNALKYTQENGRVSVSIVQKKQKIVFQVVDNGIGIAEKDLPFIFERFYRADVSRTRSTGGAGLGLSIAQSLSHTLGGKLKVKSEEGKGSCFELSLLV